MTCIGFDMHMKPYIFKAHNGVHIIDLAQTAQQLDSACNFIGNTVRGGGKVLLVGTKKQAQSIVREVAETNNQHYVTDRWLGGMLTSLKTVKKRLKRLTEIEGMEEDGSITSAEGGARLAVTSSIGGFGSSWWWRSASSEASEPVGSSMMPRTIASASFTESD